MQITSFFVMAALAAFSHAREFSYVRVARQAGGVNLANGQAALALKYVSVSRCLMIQQLTSLQRSI